MSTEKTFALKLRARREAAGLTQQQLAGQVNAAGYRMYQSTIAKIETGSRAIRLNDAVALAAALDLPLTDLLDDGDASHRAVTAARILRAAERQLREKIAAQVLRGTGAGTSLTEEAAGG